MPLGTVATVAEDRGLPALQLALDAAVMLPFLTQAAGLQPDGARLACSAEVLKHKVGRRCTIKYMLHHRDTRRPGQAKVMTGKLYRESSAAARIFRRMGTLRKGRFPTGEPFSVPAPLRLVTDLGLLLQEHIEGANLRDILAARNHHRALRLAGQWLATLHSLPPLPRLEVKSLEREVGKMDGWCSEITPHLTATEAARLRRAQNGLRWLASRLPAGTPGLIHRDFYPANLIWDGERVWVVDFDELSIGDQVLDVAHFLAHLENLAYRTGGDVNSFKDRGAVFLESYLGAGCSDLGPKLPFYKAYTLLKLAAKEGRRQQGDWPRSLRVLTGLACEEAANGLREAS